MLARLSAEGESGHGRGAERSADRCEDKRRGALRRNIRWATDSGSEKPKWRDTDTDSNGYEKRETDEPVEEERLRAKKSGGSG